MRIESIKEIQKQQAEKLRKRVMKEEKNRTVMTNVKIHEFTPKGVKITDGTGKQTILAADTFLSALGGSLTMSSPKP